MWHHHHSPCATLGEFGVGQPRPRSPPLALFCASGPRSWPPTGHHSHAIHYRHTHARTHTYLDTYIHTHTVCRTVTTTQSPSRPCRTPMHHRARRKCHSRGRHGRRAGSHAVAARPARAGVPWRRTDDAAAAAPHDGGARHAADRRASTRCHHTSAGPRRWRVARRRGHFGGPVWARIQALISCRASGAKVSSILLYSSTWPVVAC